jgi:hypothetical protein
MMMAKQRAIRYAPVLIFLAALVFLYAPYKLAMVRLAQDQWQADQLAAPTKGGL